MIRLKLILPIAILLLLAACAGSAAEKRYHADRFDVTALIEEDGSLLITEDVTFTFEGEPFTYTFRELDMDNSNGIEIVSVAIDGQQLPEGNDPQMFELDNEDGNLTVTWNMAPTLGTRQFTLQYRMLNVVRQNVDGALLRYQPLPADHDYTIAHSVVRVLYPPAASLQGEPLISDTTAAVRSNAGELIVTRTQLPQDSELVVELPFVPGSLIDSMPTWQVRQQLRREQAPFWIATVIALTLVAVGGVVLLARQGGVGARVHTTSPLYAPPDKLAPALAGALNGIGPAWANAIATLFDLADRNILQIEALPQRRWGTQQFEIHLLSRSDDLRPHEAGLLELLFEPGASRVNFNNLQREAGGKRWKRFSEPLKQEMLQAGYWNEQKGPIFRTLIIIGILLMPLVPIAIALGLLTQDRFGGLAVLLFIPLSVASVVAFTAAGMVKPLTAQGRQRAAEWQRFYTYLRAVAHGQTEPAGLDIFEQYLPYAASYGLLQPWVKRFEKLGYETPPVWFQGGDGANVASMAAFVSMTGSSGAAAAGAAGAAGGGASGAG